MICKASEKLAIGRKLRCHIVLVWLLLVLSKFSNATLPLCSNDLSLIITSSCRFTPGEHKYNSLDIQSDVFLDTSSNNAIHTFIISGDFTLRSGAVLSVFYNQESNTGAAPGNSGGSHGGRGGAESGTTLEANEGVPYGSSLTVNTTGSKGGNGGKGGGHLVLLLTARYAQMVNMVIEIVSQAEVVEGESRSSAPRLQGLEMSKYVVV
jgi:hypothetical protein